MDDPLVVVDVRPPLGIEEELEPVGRRRRVHGAHVLQGVSVVEQQETTRFVRRLVPGVRRDLVADRRRDYHHSVRSIDRSTSSAVQKSALRYFQPPSARTQTTTASSSSSAASLRATCTTAPLDTPPKTPSASRRARTAATDSSFETSTFRSSFATS